MSASSSSEPPFGHQDPFAPKRLRDQEQSRPQLRPAARPSSIEADDSIESEQQIPWRRVRPSSTPPSLIGPAPVPRPEPRRSLMAQFMLLAGVAIVSALSAAAIYRFSNGASVPAATPQLASNSARPVQTIMVTPPAPPPRS